MPEYGLVKDGAVVEYRTFTAPDLPPDPSKLHPGKPRWLPVTRATVAFDAVSQARGETVVGVTATAISITPAVRDKSDDELTAMRTDKSAEIEAQFQRLWQLPIEHDVGGETYTWHADQEAVDNIIGVLMAYRETDSIGITLPDPRNWTPLGSLKPVSVTRNELVGLGLAIAGRKDFLFVKKKAKQSEVAALTDAKAIDGYDVTTGWA